jgi:signal transduction histidine kinase
MPIGSPSYFAYLTAALYWSLVVCWSLILGFYVREYRRLRGLSPIIATLLVVIFIDGARTLVESIYFGIPFTARAHLIPGHLWDRLMEPQWVIFPKAFNLIAALIIMAVMVRRWFADLESELEQKQQVDRLYGELQRAYSDLQQLQQARDDLSQMLVHDMRTPLTNVISSLYTLQQAEGMPRDGTASHGGDGGNRDHPTRSPDGDRELTTEMVAAALSGSQRVLAMVNDLLDISRMEAGEIVPDWRPLSVETAIDEARETVRMLAEEKSIALREEPIPAELMALGDRELVRRVLVNILGNAVKFTPPGGEVAVSASQQGEWLRIAVADTGPGISAADRERIFEKFYQADRGGQQQTGAFVPSTGLGLAFCKLAVSAHGGQIGVESEPGHGSTFWFTLPAAGAPPEALAASSQPSITSKGGR